MKRIRQYTYHYKNGEILHPSSTQRHKATLFDYKRSLTNTKKNTRTCIFSSFKHIYFSSSPEENSKRAIKNYSQFNDVHMEGKNENKKGRRKRTELEKIKWKTKERNGEINLQHQKYFTTSIFHKCLLLPLHSILGSPWYKLRRKKDQTNGIQKVYVFLLLYGINCCKERKICSNSSGKINNEQKKQNAVQEPNNSQQIGS